MTRDRPSGVTFYGGSDGFAAQFQTTLSSPTKRAIRPSSASSLAARADVQRTPGSAHRRLTFSTPVLRSAFASSLPTNLSPSSRGNT